MFQQERLQWCWAKVGQKQDSLRDNAAAPGSSISINGCGGGGLKLGSVRGDGEERSEGIHCCLCGGWLESCDETV
jgi:hypothetical protein